MKIGQIGTSEFVARDYFSIPGVLQL